MFSSWSPLKQPARHVFVLVALLCLVPGQARAEETTGPTQAVSFDPLWIAYSTASLQYERLVAPAGSLAIKVRVGRTTVKPVDGEQYDRTVLGIGIGYHIYPQPGAPIGFFLAPGIDLLTRFKTTKSGSASVAIAVPLFELGYSWMHPIGLYAGGSIGMQYIIGNVQDDIGGLDTLKGFVPRVGLRLGYAW
jgi:hypothetical protein